MLLREKKIRESRNSFWTYCKTLSPDFYKEDRHHLKTICNTLQSLYEGKLRNPLTNKIYKKLALSIPPRYGKSRTLTNFASWILGKNQEERIITCSYNDELATDFSKFTRNIIQEKRDKSYEIVYSDIFPNVKIKYGTASYKQWALDGQYFTYKGAGLGGAITGKGASLLVADDLIKGAEEAFNANELKSIWTWYTGTFLSRAEEGAIQILCMTRWSKNDPIGKLLDGQTKDEWYVLEMQAYDELTDEMLCPELLSKDSYNSLKLNMDSLIFYANYHNRLIDAENKLYSRLLEWQTIPDEAKNSPIKAQIDVADTGKDYVCCIVYKEHKQLAYILDIYYSQKPMEITEVEVAKMLYNWKVNIADVESNNGGRGFARTLQRLLRETHKHSSTIINWTHQSSNKESKILTNASTIMNSIFFPLNWASIHKDAYDSMNMFVREGKNAHDDLQDTLSEIAKKLNNPNKWTWA